MKAIKRSGKIHRSSQAIAREIADTRFGKWTRSSDDFIGILGEHGDTSPLFEELIAAVTREEKHDDDAIDSMSIPQANFILGIEIGRRLGNAR